MMYPPTTQAVTWEGYPARQQSVATSRLEETDLEQVWTRLFSVWLRTKPPIEPSLYRTLAMQSVLNFDISSVWPRSETRSETSSTTEAARESAPDQLLEHDIVVRLSPKRRYSVRMGIKSIRKGEPVIIVPEEFL